MKDTVKNEIMEKLNERFNDKVVNITEVTKNNGARFTGVTIRSEEDNVVPMIYIDSLYDGDIDEVVDKIACIYNKSNKIVDFAPINDFEDVVDRLSVKLVNRDMNASNSRHYISRDFMDLSIIPIIMLDNIDGVIVVTPEILERWHVPEETVIDISIENSLRDKTPIMSISDVLCGIDIPDLDMYILTNHSKKYGANRMLDVEYLKRIADVLDSDLLIIPSSVHECIILKKGEADIDILNSMIQVVNSEEVELEDVLSDHAYVFSKETGWC